MSVVLVHGNPETIAVWDPLQDALDRDDIVCLSPPGFGAPVPDGWGATVEDYRDWLIYELEAMESPVDLVGHDWGGGHVVAVAMKRPDLLRSWSTDVTTGRKVMTSSLKSLRETHWADTALLQEAPAFDCRFGLCPLPGFILLADICRVPGPLQLVA